MFPGKRYRVQMMLLTQWQGKVPFPVFDTCTCMRKHNFLDLHLIQLNIIINIIIITLFNQLRKELYPLISNNNNLI